jgi:hypothetical protein
MCLNKNNLQPFYATFANTASAKIKKKHFQSVLVLSSFHFSNV